MCRMSRLRQAATALLLGLATTGSAHAAIAATTGAMSPIVSPVSFLDGVTESSSSIVILDEGLSLLPLSVLVNAFGPGVHDDSIAMLLEIPAGAPVHSYFVHFDPDGGVVALTGSVTFEAGQIIIGIQTHTPLLNDSDPLVGDPLATYPTGLLAFRAFEDLPGTDTVTISPDLLTASFSLVAELGVDQARIFTVPAPVPVPPAAWLAAPWLLALLRLRRATG